MTHGGAFRRASAVGLFVALCVSIFTGEALVMLVLPMLPAVSRWGGMVADATLLLVVLFPILYFLVLRPLRTHIRQREAAERTGRAYESELRATLDSTADGILALDDAGRIRHANRQFTELWRIPPDLRERGGDRALMDFVRAQVADPDAFLAQGQSPNGPECDGAATIRCTDGRTFEQHSIPMRLDGVRIGRVWSFRDVSERLESAAQVQRSAAFLQSVTDGATDAVYVKDLQGRYLMCNAATCRFVGKPAEEILGRDDLALFPPDEARALMANDRRVMADGVTVTEENLLTAGDLVRSFQSNRGPVRNEHGVVIGIFGISRDTTERRLAEESLKQSERRVRTVLENMALIGVMLDQTGRITLCNDHLLALTGWTRAEVLGQNWFSVFVPPDVRDTVGEIFRASLVDGDIPAHFENEIVTRAGVRRLIAWSNTTLRDPAGGVIGVASIGEDISARRQAEEALTRRNIFVESLLEHAPVGFAAHTMSDGRPVFVSRRFESTYGVAPGSLRSADDYFRNVFLDPAHREIMRERVTADMASGDVARMRWEDIPITTAAGEQKFITATSVPLPEQDLMISTVQDVTARNRAEESRSTLEAQLQQSQKLESVGLLAGGIAHDFNNMLGVILGTAELALTQVDGATPLYDDLLEIRKSALRSAELTRQLLAFARQQTIAPHVLDLNETVPGLLTMLQRLIGEDINLVWQPAATLWPVLMDPSQMDQILTNLCANARHAISDVGTVSLATANCVIDTAFSAAHVDAVPGDYVRFTVHDTGRGMNDATKARIFEPFFTTKAVGEGTGLGLASVYGAVRQNRGFLTVTSAVDRGTTFDIYLPRYVGEAIPGRASGAIAVAPHGDETILLVEDEAAMLRFTAKALHALGYVVLVAHGPAEAMRLAAEHSGPIHLLLSDVVMPGMNGLDLALALQAVRPTLTPLFMSGHPADVIASRGMVLPGVTLLQKPFTPAALAAKVREVLDG